MFILYKKIFYIAVGVLIAGFLSFLSEDLVLNRTSLNIINENEPLDKFSQSAESVCSESFPERHSNGINQL